MKNPSYIQINIPQPCHEDWTQMTSQQQGRFCDSCQKCVVDFTNYTDTELIDYFTKRGSKNLCGRFSDTQLNRKIFKPPTRRKYFQWVMSLGIVVFLTNLFGTDAKAQEPVQKEWRQNDAASPSTTLTTEDSSKTNKEIDTMPTRNTTQVVSTTAGGVGVQCDSSISIGGGRGNGILYIIDGIPVQGSRGINLSQGELNTIEIPGHGTPAKYSNKNMDR